MALSTAHAPLRTELFVAEEPESPGVRWPTVYIETSVISYLTAGLSTDILTAHRQRLTRVWWRRYRHHHALRVSSCVYEEAAKGSAAKSEARLHALSGIVALPLDSISRHLAERLVGGGGLPEKAQMDALHIAIAATHFVSLLVTWNYKHLANRTIRRSVARTCEVEGFRCPEVCTPGELMRAYTYARPNP
jgi:hypothetical protein